MEVVLEKSLQLPKLALYVERLEKSLEELLRASSDF
jgi:hypothetical protein